MLSRLTVPLFILLAVTGSVLAFRMGSALIQARADRALKSSPLPYVLERISFGESRGGPIAANPYAPRVYAAQEDVPAIAIIDTTSNSILGTVPTEGFHGGVDFDPTTNRLYVSQPFAKSVRVIDVTTASILQDLDVPGDSPIGAVAVNPNNYHLYVIQNDIQTVAILNHTTSGKLLGTLPIDAHYGDIAINPLTQRIYVSSPLKNEVVVVDGTNDTILTKIQTGENPKAIRVNPATNRVYIAIANENALAVLDGATNQIITSIPVGTSPTALSIDVLGNRIYVGNLASKNLTAIDGNTNTVSGTLAIGAQPISMAFVPDSRRLYVSSDDGKAVYAIQASAGDSNGKQVTVAGDEKAHVLDVTDNAPPSDWTDAAFDDSTWTSAVADSCRDANAKPSFSNTRWVWLADCTRAAQTALFRKTFTLPDSTYGGILRVRADDSAEIYLNGEKLGETQTWKNEYFFELRPYLRAGSNVLAVRVNNTAGPGGLLFQATLDSVGGP